MKRFICILFCQFFCMAGLARATPQGIVCPREQTSFKIVAMSGSTVSSKGSDLSVVFSQYGEVIKVFQGRSASPGVIRFIGGGSLRWERSVNGGLKVTLGSQEDGMPQVSVFTNCDETVTLPGVIGSNG